MLNGVVCLVSLGCINNSETKDINKVFPIMMLFASLAVLFHFVDVIKFFCTNEKVFIAHPEKKPEHSKIYDKLTKEEIKELIEKQADIEIIKQMFVD